MPFPSQRKTTTAKPQTITLGFIKEMPASSPEKTTLRTLSSSSSSVSAFKTSESMEEKPAIILMDELTTNNIHSMKGTVSPPPLEISNGTVVLPRDNMELLHSTSNGIEKNNS